MAIHTVSRSFTDAPDKIMSLETGKLALQADGAVRVTMGRTTVLLTATAARHVREGIDFFPLTVDLEERAYAAGKIPGSFFRREGRAGESAILASRLIDRPLRPSFPDGFRNEVHVVGLVLGADMTNPHDVLAINGASAALSVSPIPFSGPIGAVRIAWTADGRWIPFPTFQEGEESAFEMVVAGRLLDDGDVAIMMVEAGGTGASLDLYESGAPKVDEAVLAGGLDAAKTWIRETVELQRELMEAVGPVEPMEYEPQVDYRPEIKAAVDEAARQRLVEIMSIADKAARQDAENDLRTELLERLGSQFGEVAAAEKEIRAALRSLTKEVVRSRIVHEGVRIDGRGTADIRPLTAEVGLIPTAHGSGLFQRGETQVLNICTLGTQRMDQMIDGIDPTDRKRYMHHYNFPPFSTGETGFMRGPKRREIGHGALAERALFPVIPKVEEFPYTLRLVSEVLSSNGSTSMASVCASTLSLMDAGVPIRRPIAGIAMGLVHAEGRYTTLTDILGAEDAYGDMDFKVAGSEDFVTALQLDTKIDGIPAEVLASALEQAKDARLKILEVMREAIPEPRPDVGETAPKIISFEIPVEKIGEVIGPKGKVINAVQAETGAEISVDDDGVVGIVTIASPDRAAVAEAERQIRLIANPPTAEVGATYNGRVVNITKFGAFVNILPGRDGLVHISKLGRGKRIERVEDVVELGQELTVVVEDVDPNGKISLTPVGFDGEEAPSGNGEEGAPAPQAERSDRTEARDERSDAAGAEPVGGDDREHVSFAEKFDEELRAEFGDLGPAATGSRRGSGGGDRRRRRRR